MAKLKENSTIAKASGEELIATEPMVLSMIQENAYVHPATHPASMITGLHDSAITGVAGSVAWGNVTGKPSTFPPSSHTHSKSDVGLGNVQNYGIATQAQAQAGTANNVYMTPLRVKEAISSIAPSSHTHAWSEVTGKPSTFPPSSHTHEEYSTVQALDAHTETQAALNELGHVYHAMLTATLNTSSWTGTKAPFAQVQTVSGILATDVPIVDVVLSGDWGVDEARLEAWGYVYRIVTNNNSITAYAREKPEVALPLQLKVVR